jgi:hypothetical protein
MIEVQPLRGGVGEKDVGVNGLVHDLEKLGTVLVKPLKIKRVGVVQKGEALRF